MSHGLRLILPGVAVIHSIQWFPLVLISQSSDRICKPELLYLSQVKGAGKLMTAKPENKNGNVTKLVEEQPRSALGNNIFQFLDNAGSTGSGVVDYQHLG